jgi:FkbM family methyltransferase
MRHSYYHSGSANDPLLRIPALRFLYQSEATDLMLKEAAKRYLKSLVLSFPRCLPKSQKEAVFQELAKHFEATGGKLFEPVLCHLPRGERMSLFRHLAQSLGIQAFEILGRNGVLAGFIQDEWLFGQYCKEQSYFWNAVEFIHSIFHGCAGGTYIDIGANIGAVLVPIAKKSPSIDCFAFEPEPNNYQMLTYNVARNGVAQNVKLFRVALVEEEGRLTFELDRTNFGDHRVRKIGAGKVTTLLNEDTRTTIEVQGNRLDHFLSAQELAHPLVIKIDVQGAEPFVFAGGTLVLREADIVFVEYWPYGLRRTGNEPVELLKKLTEFFSLAALVKDHEAIQVSDFVPIADILSEFKAFAEVDGISHMNLVLARSLKFLKDRLLSFDDAAEIACRTRAVSAE